MLNTTVTSSRWSSYAFQPTPSLNAGFFIRRDNKLKFPVFLHERALARADAPMLICNNINKL
jgi:hypothetical protein